MTTAGWIGVVFFAVLLVWTTLSLTYVIWKASHLEKAEVFRWRVYDLEHELLDPPYDHDIRHCAKCWYAGRKGEFPNLRRRG